MRFRESSLPNSLDAIILKTEGAARKKTEPKHEYPPSDWPKDKDYQLQRAVEILKSTDFNTRLQQALND